MPSIFELYKKHRDQIKDMAVIRLHGPDRQGIEQVTGVTQEELMTKIEEIRKELPREQ